MKLNRTLRLHMPDAARQRGEQLRSVFIDTGENGYFSRGEFEAISTPGQMEFVTPEEIAESTVFEIRAGNTGHDIINALDNATLAPTYRAGLHVPQRTEDHAQTRTGPRGGFGGVRDARTTAALEAAV